jgi:hypothetical protein
LTETQEPTASAFQVLVLQTCATLPGFSSIIDETRKYWDLNDLILLSLKGSGQGWRCGLSGRASPSK